jgi:hypothetical protein
MPENHTGASKRGRNCREYPGHPMVSDRVAHSVRLQTPTNWAFRQFRDPDPVYERALTGICRRESLFFEGYRRRVVKTAAESM